MTESADALRAALEAAGLSLQALPEEQRAMFTSLTEEEVTRLIRMCIGRPAADPDQPAAELDRRNAPGDPGARGVPRQDGHGSPEM